MDGDEDDGHLADVAHDAGLAHDAVGYEVALPDGGDDERGQAGGGHVVNGVLHGRAEDEAHAVDVVAHSGDQAGKVQQVLPARWILYEKTTRD